VTTQPKPLTASQKKERNQAALAFATAIAGSQIIYEVLDRADGVFTSQVVRVAFELADRYIARASS